MQIEKGSMKRKYEWMDNMRYRQAIVNVQNMLVDYFSRENITNEGLRKCICGCAASMIQDPALKLEVVEFLCQHTEEKVRL